MAGETDSSFVQLFIIANNDKFKGYKFILADTDLNSLHQDPRWAEILEIVKSNEANLDKKLIAILDTIFITDQKYRLQVDSIGQKYEWGSVSPEYTVSQYQIKWDVEQYKKDLPTIEAIDKDFQY